MAKLSADLDMRWPSLDDRLVRKAVDWRKAITFSDYPEQRHVLMLHGYFRAGHALIELCQSETHEGQLVIYPILFCYRHALEMSMKWIIGNYCRRFDVSAPEPNHNLLQLWKSCSAIFEKTDNNTSAVTTAAVEKLLKEFHDLDARAEAFRYPISRNGALISLPNLAIDPTNLREVMEGLENFFSGADGYLDNLCSVDDVRDY